MNRKKSITPAARIIFSLNGINVLLSGIYSQSVSRASITATVEIPQHQNSASHQSLNVESMYNGYMQEVKKLSLGFMFDVSVLLSNLAKSPIEAL